MATKKIYVSATTEGAKATDEVWLSCTSGESIYAQTASGLTYGWVVNAGGVSYLDTSGIASGIYPATTIVAAGTSQKIRVDKPAGTYILVAIGNVPSGGYASKRLRVLDSDSSTPLWTQPAADIAGAAADYQINTDGSLVSYGASDTGVSFTTTGAQFYIEIVSTGSFNGRYSRFEIADGGTPPTISGISPSSGPVGTEVTITGTNLTGATLATHGPTVAMTGLIVDSSTQVRATIASGSPATGTIRVTTPAGTAASSTSFTVPAIFTSLFISNPNTTYVVGALLSAIVVTARDQFGTTFTGSLSNCVVTSNSLPVTVVGTLSVAFSAGVATFSNLTVSAGGSAVQQIVYTGLAPSTSYSWQHALVTANGVSELTAAVAGNTSVGTLPTPTLVFSDGRLDTATQSFNALAAAGTGSPPGLTYEYERDSGAGYVNVGTTVNSTLEIFFTRAGSAYTGYIRVRVTRTGYTTSAYSTPIALTILSLGSGTDP